MTEIEKDVDLAPLTTLGVGGPARFFARIRSLDDLVEAVAFSKKNGLGLRILGGGSNTLVSDEGVNALVLKIETQGIKWLEESDNSVLLKAAAGEEWDKVVEESVNRGLYGIENLSGIPGTAGAAPVQNIGAYGVELSDVVSEVEAYDINEERTVVFRSEECDLGYRSSLFKKESGRFVVISVKMRLTRFGSLVCHYKDVRDRINENDPPSLTQMRDLILDIRSKKFPDSRDLGSAGSFFKNPVLPNSQFERIKRKYPDIPSYPAEDGYAKVPLAWILDRVLNLKGKRHGAVGLFGSQPLVLVTYEGAREKDVTLLAEEVKRQVREVIDLDVEYEVTYLS
ncbi:MAG: UDP-N-acetylmuramate dehydrogenase [Candidatus Paceibacterota bacterium]